MQHSVANHSLNNNCMQILGYLVYDFAVTGCISATGPSFEGATLLHRGAGQCNRPTDNRIGSSIP